MLNCNRAGFAMRDEMYIILQSMERQLARIACSLERVILVRGSEEEEELEWDEEALSRILKREKKDER
jgi:hypothetical protein